MTEDVVYCFDDDVRDAASTMEEHQIRRLIVLNRDEHPFGIVSLETQRLTRAASAWRAR